MLQLHRLNNHKTMNFWRLSNNNNFSDFAIGDLVFFLSKDKEHRKDNEKGIVGFGRLSNISLASLKTMWNRYGDLNGYRTYDEFKDAIVRVSKDKKHPGKISAFYLENVCFFQPIYLSECGMQISSNVESYIYLKDETVIRLLDLAGRSQDLWSDQGDSAIIEMEKLRFALNSAHRQIGDITLDEKQQRRAKKVLNTFAEEGYSFLDDAGSEVYRIRDGHIDLILYKDKSIDDRVLIGQAVLYRDQLNRSFEKICDIRFRSSDDDKRLYYYLNTGI